MTGHLQKPSIFQIVLFFTFSSVLSVFISGALPLIQEFYEIPKARSQDVISLYLLGCFLGQFLYAPLANGIGKKRCLQLGVALGGIGVVISLLSIQGHDFSLMLAGRMITAIGTSAGPVLTFAILKDYFSKSEIQKLFAFLSLIFSLVPAFSVCLGGLIAHYLSWQMCFAAMLMYCVYLFYLSFCLHDMIEVLDFSHFHPIRVIRGFAREFGGRIFMIYGMISAFSSCYLVIFFSEIPFLARHELSLSPAAFGVYSFIPNLCLFLGACVYTYLYKKIPPQAISTLGGIVCLLVSLGSFYFLSQNDISILTIFVVPSLVFLATPWVTSSSRYIVNTACIDVSYGSGSLYILGYLLMFASIFSMHLFQSQSSLILPILFVLLSICIIFFCVLGRYLPNRE